jgi:predicted MFS family arabinose efflux permease
VTWRLWLTQASNLAAALLGSVIGRQVAEWLGIRLLPWPGYLAGAASFLALCIWRDLRGRRNRRPG